MPSTFLFYDLETFGINPQVDRIAQFACIRTNEKLEAVEEPVVLYCKIQPDYLPDIEACLLTGITPQETLQKGLCEYEFIKKVNQILSVPGTCVLGYNNIRFDDEFIRNALYRNFLDPYKREYAEHNSRWDLIDMVRLTHDLRPGNIVWPKHEDNSPSFKLEDLAKANKLTKEASHDALTDVQNTIGLARLIMESNPRLFDYCFTNRDKYSVAKMMEGSGVLVHTSRMLASEYGCTSLVVPLLQHPLRNTYILSYDLRYDPETLIKLPTEEVERLLFVAKDDADYENRIHLKGIHTNKCPILAPLKVLDEESYSRLHLSEETCRANYEKLMSAEKEVVAKLLAIYSKEKALENTSTDPDTQIYSGGFFNDSDREKFTQIHKLKPADFAGLELKVADKRVPEMLFRLKGRNYPEVLSESERKTWDKFCTEHREQVLLSRKQDREQYAEQLKLAESDKKNVSLVKELADYFLKATT